MSVCFNKNFFKTLAYEELDEFGSMCTDNINAF